jgi:hypothetical protein
VRRPNYGDGAFNPLALVRTFSFDHLVGAGEHAGRNCQAQRLSGLEVDHQHERGRLDNRQIGWAKSGHYPGGPIAGLRVGVSLGTSDSCLARER